MTTNTNPQGSLLTNPCNASRTDGAPCAAHPGPTGYCFWHDPLDRERMMEASRRGGSRRTIPLALEAPLSAEEARGILASVLAALLLGSLDPTTAKSAGYLIQIDRKIVEGQELERRIEVLESILKQRDKT